MTRKKEEAIEVGIRVEETKHNMKRRKPWHNYHRKGTYMLTLVVESRQPLLGRLITASRAWKSHHERGSEEDFGILRDG